MNRAAHARNESQGVARCPQFKSKSLEQLWHLGIRSVNGGKRRSPEARESDVLNHSDDRIFRVAFPAEARPESDPVPDWVPASKSPAREGFVDNGHFGRTHRIARFDATSQRHRNSHGLKERRTHILPVQSQALPRPRLVALDRDRRGVCPAREWRQKRHGYRLHPRQCLKPGAQPHVKIHQLLTLVTVLLGIDHEKKQVILLKTKALALQLPNGAG